MLTYGALFAGYGGLEMVRPLVVSAGRGGEAAAIARHEQALGRPAPAPTELGRTGKPRLSPRFVEWMMMLPDGWVTDPRIGLSRNDILSCLGNGVVPAQAAEATRRWLDVRAVAA